MDDNKLNKLADKVLQAHYEFDSKLHSKRHRKYPRDEFELLFESVKEYSDCVGEGDLIHRNVAKEISGLREYLEIPSFRTPGEILAKADRMEVILFSSHDPDFDGFEPPDE